MSEQNEPVVSVEPVTPAGERCTQWPPWTSLVPWIGLWLIELPLLIWDWGFTLAKIGWLGVLLPLAMYLALGVLSSLVGGLCVTAIATLLRTLRKLPPGWDPGRKLFQWNAAWAFGALGVGLCAFPLLFGGVVADPRKATVAALLGFILVSGIANWLSYRAMLGGRIAPFLVSLLGVCLAGSVILNYHQTPIGGDKDAAHPNVLLITIDTVNVSHTSTYGYHLPTTPNLTRIAEQSAKFNQAYCHVALTGPSHGSIFSGLQPQAFGVFDNAKPLPPKVQTLAEIFRSQGYFTAGIPGNVVVQERYGFNQGFDRYPQRSNENGVRSLQWEHLLPFRWCRLLWGDAFSGGPPLWGKVHGKLLSLLWGKQGTPSLFVHNANYQNTHALEALDYAGSRRTFMWLHYFDCHAPYVAEKRDYLEPTETPNFDMVHLGSIPGLFNLSHLALQPLYGDCFLKEHNVRPVVASPSEIHDLIRTYDAQLKHVDDDLGKFWDELGKRGLLENTIVVIAADHGEALYDRGYFGHSYFLYQDEMHVPLIVYWKGHIKPQEIDTPVALSDIAPTITELARVPGPSAWTGQLKKWAGQSLVPLLMGYASNNEYGSVYLNRFDHSRGIVTPDHQKLIYQAVLKDAPHAVRPWYGTKWLWFDLDSDPAETANLASSDAKSSQFWEQLTRLQGFLDLQARDIDSAPVADINYTGYLELGVSPSEAALLQSLGYLSGPDTGPKLQEWQCAQPTEYTEEAKHEGLDKSGYVPPKIVF